MSCMSAQNHFSSREWFGDRCWLTCAVPSTRSASESHFCIPCRITVRDHSAPFVGPARQKHLKILGTLHLHEPKRVHRSGSPIHCHHHRRCRAVLLHNYKQRAPNLEGPRSVLQGSIDGKRAGDSGPRFIRSNSSDGQLVASRRSLCLGKSDRAM